MPSPCKAFFHAVMINFFHYITRANGQARDLKQIDQDEKQRGLGSRQVPGWVGLCSQVFSLVK